MPRIFTRKHYERAADEMIESERSRIEKIAFVLIAIPMFAQDGPGSFSEDRFLRACGFGEHETVESLSEELDEAHDTLEAAAGR